MLHIFYYYFWAKLHHYEAKYVIKHDNNEMHFTYIAPFETELGALQFTKVHTHLCTKLMLLGFITIVILWVPLCVCKDTQGPVSGKFERKALIGLVM